MNAPLRVKNDCMVFVRFTPAGRTYAYRSTKRPKESDMVVVKTPSGEFKVLSIDKIVVGSRAAGYRDSCPHSVKWQWLVSIVDLTEFNKEKVLG